MNTTDDTNAAFRGSGSNDLLGPAAEENGDDQAWDRNAERITREALGDDVTRLINPHATSIDDL